MSLQDIIAADASTVFLNGDVSVSITITLQEGGTRVVQAVKEGDPNTVFETGTADLDYDVDGFLISAVSDVTGRIDPKVSGRGGNSGDSFQIGGTGTVWYFRKITQDGRPAANGGCGSGMHRILCATSKAAWPEG